MQQISRISSYIARTIELILWVAWEYGMRTHNTWVLISYYIRVLNVYSTAVWLIYALRTRTSAIRATRMDS